MLPDLDAEAPSSALDRPAATLAILWASDSATNADGRATAGRPIREPRNHRRGCLLAHEGSSDARLLADGVGGQRFMLADFRSARVRENLCDPGSPATCSPTVRYWDHLVAGAGRPAARKGAVR